MSTNTSEFNLNLNGLVTEINNMKDSNSVNLFDVKWSDHRLNDMSWLRSDTFSWHNGEVYSAAYQELLSEYTNRSDNTVYKAFVKSNYTAVSSDIKEWRGIVQGFDGSAYITHTSSQPTTSLEYVLKVYTVSPKANASIINASGNFAGPVFRINDTSGNINLYLTTNGSSWNIANNVSTTCTLPANTWKWFKLVWNGSTFVISESLDGNTYTQKYSVACAAAPKFNGPWLGGGNSSYQLWGGKFDLQECYFKADGNTVWSGADYLDYVITDKKYRVVLPNQTENLQRIYNDYGVAWYYVLDSTNERFKLPRTKFGFTGLRDGVGEFVEAGLPNITGQTSQYNDNFGILAGTYITTGAFTTGTTRTAQFNGSKSGTSYDLAFDASLSNPIYSNSDTVQPPATEMYLYHYVGDFNRQAVLANIGVTSENIDSTSFLNTPVGTIIWSMANSVPAGYLVCNGQAVGRLAYPELFSAIGTTYGDGDGDSTFNLPNLIGKFVEGNATAGIEHEAGLPNIEGSIGISYATFDNDESASRKTSGAFSLHNVSSTTAAAGNNKTNPTQVNFNASNSNSIYGNSTTVQPPSLTAMPCIKAFDAVVNDGTVDVNELIHEVPARVYNTKEILTTSGTYTVPVTGWYKCIVIGAGGGGTKGHNYVSGVGSGGGGGGGGSGYVVIEYIYLTAGTQVSCVIGAGGAKGTTDSMNGGDGGTTSFGSITANGGKGSVAFLPSTQGNRTGCRGGVGGVCGTNGGQGGYSGRAGSGGNGGSTGLGFGGGGGGGNGAATDAPDNGEPYGLGNDGGENGSPSASTSTGGAGGDGGPGAIILEYFNPATSTN